MADHGLTGVLAASSLACGVTTLGIYVISRNEAWSKKNIAYVMSFAAGVLVSVSPVYVIPTAFQMRAGAPIWLLGGFLALYLLNRFLNLYICHEHRAGSIPTGITPAVGSLAGYLSRSFGFFGRFTPTGPRGRRRIRGIASSPSWLGCTGGLSDRGVERVMS